MSLQENWNTEIPPDTAKIGRQILAETDPYRLVGDGVNDLLNLDDFTRLYSTLGRGAICPIILSLITVFQFLENIPDRAAARWAVTRLDWKYALHMRLTWLGFHYSDLSNFRKRLLEHEAERLIFNQVLAWVQNCGFVRKYGKQRSDSTHVLGCVERLSRLELVWETLRVTLGAIQAIAPDWYTQVIPAAFHEVYAERQSDWRLNKAEVEAEMHKVGRDGFWLLDHLNKSTPEPIVTLTEVGTLRTVWAQQFERQPDGQRVSVRPPSGRGKGKDLIVSPHETEVRWSKKRNTTWIGYRLEVTETAEDDVTCQFITDIDVVTANTYDSEIVDELHARLIERNLKPKEHYVDQGYTSGANLTHSAERSIELLGPVAVDTNKKPVGYGQTDFQLDFEAQHATCPAGKISKSWNKRPQDDGRVEVYILFRDQCNGCSVRQQCAPGKSGRTLTINPYHPELEQRRVEQETQAFKDKMKRRPAVEGTISELTRKHGARRARYRGQAKVRLQALFTGAAVNLKRLARASMARMQAPAGAMAAC